jgi:hypothetical protein
MRLLKSSCVEACFLDFKERTYIGTDSPSASLPMSARILGPTVMTRRCVDFYRVAIATKRRNDHSVLYLALIVSNKICLDWIYRFIVGCARPAQHAIYCKFNQYTVAIPGNRPIRTNKQETRHNKKPSTQEGNDTSRPITRKPHAKRNLTKEPSHKVHSRPPPQHRSKTGEIHFRWRAIIAVPLEVSGRCSNM